MTLGQKKLSSRLLCPLKLLKKVTKEKHNQAVSNKDW